MYICVYVYKACFYILVCSLFSANRLEAKYINTLKDNRIAEQRVLLNERFTKHLHLAFRQNKLHYFKPITFEVHLL